MYSYEDRMRAVELYIKLGKRVGATLRQLGYPTKNSLKSWYREYERRLDLPIGYAGRRPKYSPAQKEVAVEYYRTHDRCIAATIRALGYPGRDTLLRRNKVSVHWLKPHNGRWGVETGHAQVPGFSARNARIR